MKKVWIVDFKTPLNRPIPGSTHSQACSALCAASIGCFSAPGASLTQREQATLHRVLLQIIHLGLTLLSLKMSKVPNETRDDL